MVVNGYGKGFFSFFLADYIFIQNCFYFFGFGQFGNFSMVYSPCPHFFFKHFIAEFYTLIANKQITFAKHFAEHFADLRFALAAERANRGIVVIVPTEFHFEYLLKAFIFH